MKKLVVLMAVLALFAGQSMAQDAEGTTTVNTSCNVLVNIQSYCFVTINGDLVFTITGNPDKRFYTPIITADYGANFAATVSTAWLNYPTTEPYVGREHGLSMQCAGTFGPGTVTGCKLEAYLHPGWQWAPANNQDIGDVVVTIAAQ